LAIGATQFVVHDALEITGVLRRVVGVVVDAEYDGEVSFFAGAEMMTFLRHRRCAPWPWPRR
jgi:hypothetical protein